MTYAVKEYCRVFSCFLHTEPVISKKEGKPYVENLPLFISLSHSGRWLVAAVSEDAAGIDIEEEKELPFQAVAARFMDRVPETKEDFFALWTAKEAYAKGTDKALIDVLKNPVSDVRTYRIGGYTLSVYGKGGIFMYFPDGSDCKEKD